MDMEELYNKIYRYCYFKLYDKQLAQDITQETFLRFFQQNISSNIRKELPYLYTIAKNLCADNFRKKSVESLENVTEETIYNPTDDWINHLTLKSILSKLPQEEQELIFLRYVNEISITTISKITGVSRFAIHRKLSKIIKWLKEQLKKEGFSE